MRKTVSLLLALVMIISVFAACGEKTEAPVTPGDDSAASADATVPATATDDEEGDKEATETVTETGDVTLPPENTQTPADAPQTTQTPQTQTPQSQTAPDTSTSAPPAQQTTSGGSAATPLPPENRKYYSIYVWGDAVVNVHTPFDILYGMARAAGHDVDLNGGAYDNLGASTTYSLYELFTYTGSGADVKATGFKNAKFQKTVSSPLDCLIILVSRDRSMMGIENETKLIEAFDMTQKAYYAANPNGRIILLAPMPYKDTQGEHGVKFKVNDTDSHGHSERIKAFAQKMAAKATGNIMIEQLGDAFEWFEKNYAAQGYEIYDQGGIYQSVAGAYFISCLTYAYLWNESPVGITEYGYLTRDAAEFIQKAAHKFVFGTDAPSSVNRGTPIPHDAFEQCDPRTMSKRDERFKNEVYPKYFDEFFATAYCYEAFGGAVQYDQNNIAKASGATRRLHQGVDPTFITPQRISYLDCTWFCHSVYDSAFNYVIKETVNTKVIET
ncbi:MAG: hypothetical protein IJS65_08330, partial [Clostridia bacterium]|nr:hypothetical protein [Clostridia bacterium]